MKALNKKKGGGEKHALLRILWYGNFLLLGKFLVGFALIIAFICLWLQQEQIKGHDQGWPGMILESLSLHWWQCSLDMA